MSSGRGSHQIFHASCGVIYVGVVAIILRALIIKSKECNHKQEYAENVDNP